jgi:DNA repair protein RecO (recombination protein O)
VHGHYSNPENSAILAAFFESSYENVKNIPLTGGQRNEILDDLLNYFYIHLPGLTRIKSLDVLKEVFGQ